MQLSEDELARAAEDAHAVIEQAKVASVYVFGGGINEDVKSVPVSAAGEVTSGTYSGTNMTCRFAVLELPTRRDAKEWARKIAVACRCSQELREFMHDPAT